MPRNGPQQIIAWPQVTQVNLLAPKLRRTRLCDLVDVNDFLNHQRIDQPSPSGFGRRTRRIQLSIINQPHVHEGINQVIVFNSHATRRHKLRPQVAPRQIRAINKRDL